jgi:hypothetical protein
MNRLMVSRLLDGAGCVLVALAAILFAASNNFTAPVEPGFAGGVSRAAGNIFDFITQWICCIFGVLLFLGRPLLWLRWWRSWIAFLAVGVLLLVVAFNDINSTERLLQNRSFDTGKIDTVVELAGFASILMGFIFFVAQSLVRRSERSKEDCHEQSARR